MDKPTLQNTVFCSILYKTRRWLPAFLGTFRDHLPGACLYLVENNPLPGEADYSAVADQEKSLYETEKVRSLYDQIIGVPRSYTDSSGVGVKRTRASHGYAMDYILEYFRRIDQYKFIVFIEPDTLFLGSGWFTDYLACVPENAGMMAIHTLPNGMPHPSGTLWRLSRRMRSCRDCPFPAEYPYDPARWKTVRWSYDQIDRLEQSWRMKCPSWVLIEIIKACLGEGPPEYLDVCQHAAWVGMHDDTYAFTSQPTDFAHLWLGSAERRIKPDRWIGFLQNNVDNFPELQEFESKLGDGQFDPSNGYRY